LKALYDCLGSIRNCHASQKHVLDTGAVSHFRPATVIFGGLLDVFQTLVSSLLGINGHPTNAIDVGFLSVDNGGEVFIPEAKETVGK
jgi:hypothetical protein